MYCVCVYVCVCPAASDTTEKYAVCAYALPTISDGAAPSYCYMDLFWIQERRCVTNTGTTYNKTIKIYTSNSKLMLAIITCIVNNMQT